MASHLRGPEVLVDFGQLEHHREDNTWSLASVFKSLDRFGCGKLILREGPQLRPAHAVLWLSFDWKKWPEGPSGFRSGG